MRELRCFFAGLVENVFCSNLSVCNPETTDYFASLLCSYIHVDDLFPFQENAKIVSIEKLHQRHQTSEQKRKFYRYVGDFTIFWTGLYPENIRNLMATGLGFNRLDFMHQGKRFYKAASLLTEKEQKPPPYLLKDLSKHYDHYAHGLSMCRKEFS